MITRQDHAAYSRALNRALDERQDVWISRRVDEATLRTGCAATLARMAPSTYRLHAVVRYSEDVDLGVRRAETVML